MSLQVNRNINCALLSYSAKTGRAIDLRAFQTEMEATERKEKAS